MGVDGAARVDMDVGGGLRRESAARVKLHGAPVGGGPSGKRVAASDVDPVADG